MKLHHCSLLLLSTLMLALLSPTSHAGSVYKCRTADGKTVYQSAPCASGEKLPITSQPTAEQDVVATQESRAEQIKALDEKRDAARTAAEEREKKQQEQQQKCEAAQKRLAALQRARRVKGDDGNYLDDAEVKKRIADAEKDVSESCKK